MLAASRAWEQVGTGPGSALLQHAPLLPQPLQQSRAASTAIRCGPAHLCACSCAQVPQLDLAVAAAGGKGRAAGVRADRQHPRLVPCGKASRGNVLARRERKPACELLGNPLAGVLLGSRAANGRRKGTQGRLRRPADAAHFAQHPCGLKSSNATLLPAVCCSAPCRRRLTSEGGARQLPSSDQLRRPQPHSTPHLRTPQSARHARHRTGVRGCRRRQ